MASPFDAAPRADRSARMMLAQRMRRNRRTDWSRRLVRENELTVNDLIWPIFLIDGERARQPVASMPGVDRLTIDEAVRAAAHAAELGIPALALFPSTPAALKGRDRK